MKISELNERALIKRIAHLLTRHDKNIVVGAGEDDCAVLDIGGEDFLLLTTDMLHRKTDCLKRCKTAWDFNGYGSSA